MDETRLAIYLHIPFCQSKCTYCDFNSYAGLEHLFEPYLDALIGEASWLAARFRQPVGSLYVGGGTPTRLPVGLLMRLLDECRRLFNVEADAEISCEANPGTVSASGLHALRKAGVNRLSLGAQSFDAAELALLGRVHDPDQVRQAVHYARAAGFGNLSLDLIYGLPRQRLVGWRASLEQALALAPEHLSLYCLSLEPNTPLTHRVIRRELPAPDPDLAADMYDLASELLAAAGYQQYEISNWSRPGYACVHNLAYWRNQPYLGLGAGAHSSTGEQRWWNVYSVPGYLDAMQTAGISTSFRSAQDSASSLVASSVYQSAGRRGGNGGSYKQGPMPGGSGGGSSPGGTRRWPSPAAQGGEVLDRATQLGETLMLGLRLTAEGVSEAEIQRRFGVSLEEAYGPIIRELSEQGLLSWQAGRLRLTARARLLGNRVFARFLPD